MEVPAVSDLTNTDLHRDIGRMEGRLDGMDDRLSKIEAIAERIDGRLANLEARESERKGAWWTLGTLAAIIGAFAGAILSHFWK
jgi:hypothetical protein